MQKKKSKKKLPAQVAGVDLRSVLVGLIKKGEETDKLIDGLFERNKEREERNNARDLAWNTRLMLMRQEILRMEPDVARDVFERLIDVATHVVTFLAGEQPKVNTGASGWLNGSPDTNKLVQIINITDFKIKSKRLLDRRNAVTHPKDVTELHAAVIQVRDAVNRHRPFMEEEYVEDDNFRFADEVITTWEKSLMWLAAEI